jgi:hypothetical protein
MLQGIKRNFILLLLLISCHSGFCASDPVEVFLLTLEPGIEPYTIFGHTAIRIKDDSSHTDRIYNFGTFNFSTPHFYWKFLKGDLTYYLSTSAFRNYMRAAIHNNRKVWEQKLCLDRGEKRKIRDNLEKCYNSAGRYYRYNFFHDNCATRVRDAIFNALNTTAVYDTGLFCCKTFRQLLDPYISVNYWYDVGINLVLGKEADRMASPDDFMFLPDYIMEVVESAQLTGERQLIANALPPQHDRNRFSYALPWIIIALLVLVSLPLRTRKFVFYGVLSAFGLMGLFLLCVSLISVNSGFRNNYNIAWLIPSLLILIIRNTGINDVLKIIYASLLVLMMIFRNYLPQEVPQTFLPWILLLVFVLLVNLHTGFSRLSDVGKRSSGTGRLRS